MAVSLFEYECELLRQRSAETQRRAARLTAEADAFLAEIAAQEASLGEEREALERRASFTLIEGGRGRRVATWRAATWRANGGDVRTSPFGTRRKQPLGG